MNKKLLNREYIASNYCQSGEGTFETSVIVCADEGQPVVHSYKGVEQYAFPTTSQTLSSNELSPCSLDTYHQIREVTSAIAGIGWPLVSVDAGEALLPQMYTFEELEQELGEIKKLLDQGNFFEYKKRISGFPGKNVFFHPTSIYRFSVFVGRPDDFIKFGNPRSTLIKLENEYDFLQTSYLEVLRVFCAMQGMLVDRMFDEIASKGWRLYRHAVKFLDHGRQSQILQVYVLSLNECRRFDEAIQCIEWVAKNVPGALRRPILDEAAKAFVSLGKTDDWGKWLHSAIKDEEMRVHGRARMLFFNLSWRTVAQAMILRAAVPRRNGERRMILAHLAELNHHYKIALWLWKRVESSRFCDEGLRRKAKRLGVICAGKWTGDWSQCRISNENVRNSGYIGPSEDLWFAKSILEAGGSERGAHVAARDTAPEERFGAMRLASEKLKAFSEEGWKDLAIEAMIQCDDELARKALAHVADEKFVRSLQFELDPGNDF